MSKAHLLLPPPQWTLGNIAARQAGTDDFECGEVPAMPLMPVLALGTKISDVIEHLLRRILPLSPPKIATRCSRDRVGPHGTGNEFEQLCLARTVFAEQQPSLCRLEPPIDSIENQPLVTVQ
jgi:hypothetical protein